MSEKVCIWCKQDCSQKPRQKDAKGHYLCQECVKPYLDAMKSKAQPSAAVAREQDDQGIPLEPTQQSGGMGDLLDQQVAKVSQTCESCGRPMARDAVICTHCGYNTESGRQHRSRVVELKEKKEKRASNVSISDVVNPTYVTLGLLVISGGLFFASWSNPAFLALLYVWGGLVGTVGFVYLIFAAFKDGHTGWGVISLLMFVPILNLLIMLVLLYYVFGITHRGMLKGLYLTAIISVVLAVLGFVQIAQVAEATGGGGGL
jgi:hypothetical protein